MLQLDAVGGKQQAIPADYDDYSRRPATVGQFHRRTATETATNPNLALSAFLLPGKQTGGSIKFDQQQLPTVGEVERAVSGVVSGRARERRSRAVKRLMHLANE